MSKTAKTQPTIAALEAEYAKLHAMNPSHSWESFEANANDLGLDHGSAEWLQEVLAEAIAEGASRE